MTSYFPWSDEYSVHLRVIDNDHKDLVETVNNLHEAIKGGATRGQVGQIISNLAHYVDEHFTREEELMETYNYPDVVRHKRIHRHLTRTVFAIRIIFNSKPKRIDPVKLLEFLRDWLVHHILDEDMKYAPFMRGDKPAKRAAGDAESDGTSTASDSLVDGQADGDEDGASGAADEAATEADVMVTFTVPAAKAAALRRCARLLIDGGAECIAIEDIVMPVSNMTFDEALHFARPVLR